MHPLFLMVSLIVYSRASDPCDGAPSSALAAVSGSVGGWVAGVGDNLWVVDAALGLKDVSVIPALNPNIINPNEILAGSSYCIPYTSSPTSATWSTSGALPWLQLLEVTTSSAPGAGSITSLLITSLSGSETSSTTLTKLPITSASDSGTISTTLPTTSSTAGSGETSTASLNTPASDSGTSSTTLPTASSEIGSTASLITSSTLGSGTSSTAFPTTLTSMLCGSSPSFVTSLPQYYESGFAENAQCIIDCDRDNQCKAFGYEENICYLFSSNIYFPFNDPTSTNPTSTTPTSTTSTLINPTSGNPILTITNRVTYWNMACFTNTILTIAN